jgi:hypothetical protein
MRLGNVHFLFGAFALVAASSASAAVNVTIEVNPFGYGQYPAPVVVYQPHPFYAPPPVVYEGRDLGVEIVRGTTRKAKHTTASITEDRASHAKG